MHPVSCAILDDYQSVALGMADWAQLNERVRFVSFQHHIQDTDTLIQTLAPFDIVIAMRERTAFPASVLSRLPRLRLLVTTGMRNASIDLNAAAAHGIVVCGTASLSEPPTELTWALILGLAKHIVPENESFRSRGPWQQTIGMDLHGKQLGLIGLGRIGGRVARVAQAFGMHVVAWSQNLTAERANQFGTTFCPSKEQLLANSDVVSIHLQLSDRTRGLLQAPDLRQMKPSALLINTSRAAIVNQDALYQALEQRWIAGAGIDVFDMEPLPPDHPFRSLSNLLATPHLGYVTEQNYKVYFQEALENIHSFLQGTPLRILQ